MVSGAIADFKMYNKGLAPVQLLYYRDGVSESEYQAVYEAEYSAIRAAYGNIEFTCTFMFVTKRHHVRFFPTSQSDHGGKSGNLPCGFVADKSIASPLCERDFWMISHGGLMGTSRPSHYVVMRNDHSFLEQKLEEISYYLCHIHQGSASSISIPAPIYYADRVCDMTRKYYFDEEVDYGDDRMTQNSTIPYNENAWKRGHKQPKDRRMYWV